MENQECPKPLPLYKNTLWNAFGCILYQGCIWLTTILVVMLSPNYENSGILAFAMTIGNIFYPLATYNTRAFQASDVSNEYSNSNYVAFRLVTCVGAFAICAAYCAVISPSSATIIASIAFLIFKFDEAFANVLYGIDQKNLRMDYIGVSQLMRGPLLLVAFALSLYLWESLTAAISAMAVTCFTVTLLYDIPHSRRFGKVMPSITKCKVKRILIQCMPLVVSATFCGAIVAVSREYFGIVQGEELLGIYAAVATPTVIAQAAAVYLYSPFITPMAKAWNESDISAFIRLLLIVTGALLFLSTILITVFFLFGDAILILLFGQSIAAYAYLLIPALIGTALISFMYLSTDLLVLMRKFVPLTLATMVSFLFCLINMEYFINQFGMNGINLVVIFSNALGCILMMTYIIRVVYSRRK